MPPTIDSKEYETVNKLVDGAGWAGSVLGFIRFLYEYGKASPIEYAIEDLRRELETLKAKLQELNERLNIITQRQVAAENRARMDKLEEHQIRLSSLAFQLSNDPTDRVKAAEVAFEAGLRADAFLTDRNLWLWSDVCIITPRNEYGEVVGETRIEAVEPDFKTIPALPVYSMALTVWITAIMIETGGDRALVEARHGDKLRQHLAAVSLSDEWRDNGHLPTTLPEQIRSRIRCEPIAVHKYAQNGQCTFSVQCSNVIEQSRYVVREFSVPVDNPGPTHLCTINPEVVILDEQQIEDEDPSIVTIGLWEKMLQSVVSTGHLPREQFIGQFPNWRAVIVDMYGVDPQRNLHYFNQILPSNDGSWSGPLAVGTGWSFEAIVPGGVSVVFAKQHSGEWLWYRHNGSEKSPPTDAWSGPLPAGKWSNEDVSHTEWNYFGGGHGVIYGIVRSDVAGIDLEGDMHWVRHNGYLSGQGGFTPVKNVGHGWQSFLSVFSCGNGVIYGVRPNGVLRWYRHTDWLNGGRSWEVDRDLDTGVDWSRFERIIPAEKGTLYGVFPNGVMHCYRHLDWETGGPRFEGPLPVGDSWRFYRPLFALLPGASESIVR